jgi:hypothetical protein
MHYTDILVVTVKKRDWRAAVVIDGYHHSNYTVYLSPLNHLLTAGRTTLRYVDVV